MGDTIQVERNSVRIKFCSPDADEAQRLANVFRQRWLAAVPGRVEVSSWYTEQETVGDDGVTLYEAAFDVTVYDPIEASQ